MEKEINLRMKKCIGSFVLFTFIWAIIEVDNLSAANFLPSLTSNELILPPEQGRVIEFFQGSSKKTVICIEDIHSNTEVQKNINSILKD